MILVLKEHLFAVLRASCTRRTRSSRASTSTTRRALPRHLCICARPRRSSTRAGPTSWSAGAATSTPARGRTNRTKQVGYELGLRELSVCTGCGPGREGADEGCDHRPFQQRIRMVDIGTHRAGIIAAEPPNPIVPAGDHAGHREAPRGVRPALPSASSCSPGGAGMAEEIPPPPWIPPIPASATKPLPLVFTGPRESGGTSASSTAIRPGRLAGEARALARTGEHQRQRPRSRRRDRAGSEQVGHLAAPAPPGNTTTPW